MPQRTQSKKALLIRLDRLGDLVLTLPADEQDSLKNFQCTWYISKGLGFVPQAAQPPRHFVEWKKEFSWAQFFEFIKAVRALNPDVSIAFQSPAWVLIALFIARVPLRIGVLSRWPSFLFLNRGVRQRRSQVFFHELEYNHLLVHNGFRDIAPIQFPYLKLKAEKSSLSLPDSYVIVHPGMAGSALNWPREHYKKLIEKLSAHFPVVITGTAADNFILDPLKQELSGVSNIHWLNGQLSGPQLLSVLAGAKALLAPSTGVIHLSASLSTPTFGLYSPIKVESAKRWGPKGHWVKTMTPSVDGDNCMALVTPEEIYDNMMEKLK